MSSVLDGYDEESVLDFTRFLNDATGAFGYAVTGINVFRDRILDVQAQYPPNRHNRIFLGSGPPEPGNRAYQSWQSLDVPARLDPNGPVLRQIGNQWAVAVFHEWDEYFRGKIAAASGISKDELCVPPLGDLRLIRNDIIHNRGVMSAQAAGRCEALQWFSGSEPIFITIAKVDDFVSRFGLTFTI